jgi:hypothetical protein
MALELINNFVLLPHAPNWSDPPAWSRAWQTGVAEAVTGDESRAALRGQPRISLTWLISTRTPEEETQLDDRLRAAKKSGKACAPYWGRGDLLTAAVTAEAVHLEDMLFDWRIGDWIFLLSDQSSVTGDQLWEVGQVAAIVGNVLTLAAPVGRTYVAGLLAWPLLFGKFTAQDLGADTNWHGSVKATLQELVSRDSAVVGATVATGAAGIGVMEIETNFIVS